MEVEGVDMSQLLKAFAKFERFRVHDNTEQERAGTIQAFEYCFELSWKTMKRLLAGREQLTNSPKETFRMAALEGFIDDPEQWFEFLMKRNMTVHTYNESDADQVVAIFPGFSDAVRHFLSKLNIAP